MKTFFLILFASLSLAFCGCGSVTNSTLPAQKIQTILTNVLPPDFVGDFEAGHHNPWFNLGFKIGNVRKNKDGLWTWDSFEYERSDMLNTGGKIKLSPRAPVTPLPSS